MEVAFPWPVRIARCVPHPEGHRHDPFVNVDGEPFGRPKLGGFWRVEMDLFARGQQAQMALSSFITAMSDGVTTCVLPIAVQWRPQSANGRKMIGSRPAPNFTRDHTGFASEPYDGYTLLAAAQHRHSYIDVLTPGLASVMPGQFLTLGNRLHQITNATPINELPRRMRLSIWPNVREAHPNGAVVIVDQLRLRMRMENGEPVDPGRGLFKTSHATFVEAF